MAQSWWCGVGGATSPVAIQDSRPCGSLPTTSLLAGHQIERESGRMAPAAMREMEG